MFSSSLVMSSYSSSSLVMSSTLLKIGVRKEAMSKKKKKGGRVGSGENGRVV